MRKGLIVLLGAGVVFGYGSAFARMAHHRHGGDWRGGCHSSRWDDRTSDARGEEGSRFNAPNTVVNNAPPPPAASPSNNIVVQAPAPAAAPQPLIIVIPQGNQAGPQTIVVPTQAAPAQVVSPAPKTE